MKSLVLIFVFVIGSWENIINVVKEVEVRCRRLSLRIPDMNTVVVTLQSRFIVVFV